jgi:hypothetical protein
MHPRAQAGAARCLAVAGKGVLVRVRMGVRARRSPLPTGLAERVARLKCNHNVVLCAYIWLFFRKCDFTGLFCVPR